ncbi:MAG: hypothetical protein LAP39_17170 [Acidobacteriia bacterium]|nr:hypothetical protein [Terriglobia bacterium]
MKRGYLFLNLILLSLLAAVPILHAQDNKTTEGPQAATAETHNWPVKLFQVKYANVNHLANLFRAFGATVQPEADLKAISVRAPKEVLAAIEESLQRLDVPQAPAKNVQLDAYLLTASGQGSSANVPGDLEPVIKQLKSVFNYQGFRLLGTLSWRGRDGAGGVVTGLLPSVSGDSAQQTYYTFKASSVAITSEGKERTIRINDLRLQLDFTVKGAGMQHASIDTSIDAREGQKIVVGKANIDNADNALILILTAKVIE